MTNHDGDRPDNMVPLESREQRLVKHSNDNRAAWVRSRGVEFSNNSSRALPPVPIVGLLFALAATAALIWLPPSMASRPRLLLFGDGLWSVLFLSNPFFLNCAFYAAMAALACVVYMIMRALGDSMRKAAVMPILVLLAAIAANASTLTTAVQDRQFARTIATATEVRSSADSNSFLAALAPSDRARFRRGADSKQGVERTTVVRSSTLTEGAWIVRRTDITERTSAASLPRSLWSIQFGPGGTVVAAWISESSQPR